MNDQEIIQQYHTQEKNKEIVRNFYNAINNNDWNALEQLLDRRNPETFSKELQKDGMKVMGFDDPEWYSIRSEEYKVYEKFTQHFQLIEQLTGVTLSTPSTAMDLRETVLEKSQLIKQIIVKRKNRHHKIVQMLAEGNVVMCRLIITDKDPKSGLTIKFPSNEYYFLKNETIIGGSLVDHLLSPLIQLGKIFAESEEESTRKYIQSLKILGFID